MIASDFKKDFYSQGCKYMLVNHLKMDAWMSFYLFRTVSDEYEIPSELTTSITKSKTLAEWLIFGGRALRN